MEESAFLMPDVLLLLIRTGTPLWLASRRCPATIVGSSCSSWVSAYFVVGLSSAGRELMLSVVSSWDSSSSSGDELGMVVSTTTCGLVAGLFPNELISYNSSCPC